MTVVPIESPAASRHHLRQRLVALIDRLILALDAIDGDPDLEPSIGFSEVAHYESQAHAAHTAPIGGEEWTDLEVACEDEGAFDGDNDTSDYEDSLCGITFGASSTRSDG